MLEALGRVLEIRFEERALWDDSGIDAWILQDADSETLKRVAHTPLPSYAVISRDQRLPCGESSVIEFSKHRAVPAVLWDRRISAGEAVGMMALPRQLGNLIVLAAKDGAPVWAMLEGEGVAHYYAASDLPELSDGQSLFHHLQNKRFLHLLPLFLFLKSLVEDQRWETPALQACFMFDDPNLHWRTYGFIDFSQIAAHANKHNYHVCFATIPLDTWFVHKPTAEIFRQHYDQISLLIHGNNHTALELAGFPSDEARNRNLREALKRIGVFERRSDVDVARIMVPPHGACDEKTLKEMAQLGFEAACISHGSLLRYNKGAPWVQTLGIRPAENIGGQAVLPRFPFPGNCHNSILIAAILGQPIIARGHHHDVADGLKALADLSSFVNSLGTVHWSDMKRIARSQYAHRLDGRALLVRMFTRRVEIGVPEGTSQIVVQRPWFQGAECMTFAWQVKGEGSGWKIHQYEEYIPVRPGQQIAILSERPIVPGVESTDVRTGHLWPFIRRQLTESRDRLAPALRRITAFSVKSTRA